VSPADDPSEDLEVRRTVLDEHDELRRQLDQIDACLAQAAAGHGQGFVEARQRFHAMLVFFLGHLDHEEALLTPLLSGCEAWGPVRLEQLLLEHAAQRLEVAELAALDTETSANDWAVRMKQFGISLRIDMAGEEYDFIHPNALPRHPGPAPLR